MSQKKNSYLEFSCIAISIATIIATPWVNSDSLIIPKLITLFCVALYLVPQIIVARKIFTLLPLSKVFLSIVVLYLIQLILVLITSSAPIEQQFYGRTGRGLGFAFEFSFIIILLISFIYIDKSKLRFILLTLIISCFASSTYSVFQRFNLDIFEWDTRTNGIIGTLGNPNFQSSFAAMALIPAVIFLSHLKFGYVYSLLLVLPLIFVIYISQSTQGYILISTLILVFLTLYYWYKIRILSLFFISAIFIGAAFTVLGMLNYGILSKVLYKGSVQSRAEMYDTAIRIIQDKPLFGLGLDTTGDYYLMYRSEASARGIGEYVDNVHNVFLNNAATGGIPMSLLYLAIVLFALYSFFTVQRKINKFDVNLTALFCAWLGYQIQSLISPTNISMAAWNALISGAIIGIAHSNDQRREFLSTLRSRSLLVKPIGYVMLILSFTLAYPYFKVDQEQLKSARTADAALAIKSAKSFPQSTVRYARIGQAIINSNLGPQALEIGRAAVNFNPNAPSAWSIILINNSAPRAERIKAQQEMIRLDPHNQELKTLLIP